MPRHQDMMDDQMDDGPSKCGTFIYYTWKICTSIFSHVMLVSMVVTYCIAGAFIFEDLEAKNELKVKENIGKIRHNVTRDLWGLTKNSLVLHHDNWTVLAKTRLKTFEQALLVSMRSDGWDGDEDTTRPTQWTFIGALFYSIIVITTIGYGHIAPKTHWGKIVTIFYAILGIPLMLLCLSNIGDIMAQSFRFLYWRVCCYVCTRKPKRPQMKRGRSVRGTVRQASGGPGPNRSSWRSQTTSSFKRSGRTSQRSADSALGLSDGMTRSTYSDTEYRYPEDADRDVNRGGNRFSQHSRFSDTVLMPGQNAQRMQSPLAQVPNDMPLDADPRGAPVLFNKYALDIESSQRNKNNPSRNHSDSLRRPHHLDIPTPPPFPPSPNPDNISTKSNSLNRRQLQQSRVPTGHAQPRECRARIMSPMGFAISRQQSQRVSRGSSRMSRVREDAGDYYDYDTMDYDYDDSSSGQRSKTKQVPIWLCVFLVVTYILGGAFLFKEWEGWNFLDAVYFCFISLTTIGFGDFVPAQKNARLSAEKSIALCSLYLLFGIALLAMSFNLVQEEVIKNVKSVAKTLGILKDDVEDDD